MAGWLAASISISCLCIVLGQVIVSAGLDYETLFWYQLSVTVQDFSLLNITETLNITVLDDQEPPVITNLPNISMVSDGPVINDLVYAISSWDPEGDAVIYSITQDPDVNMFVIDSNG